MPWTSSDASRHNKSLRTSTQRRAWAEIADKALASGKSESSAIRIANSAAPRAKHSRHYAQNMARYGPRKSRRQ